MQTRRDFITAAVALGATAGLHHRIATAAESPKKILFLGGTGFIGPHGVQYALQRGHEVSIFNRGRSGAGIFGKDVEELIGDRRSDLTSLKGRTWDAVIDESASTSEAPEWVRKVANLLKNSVDQYVYISSRAVYADTSQVPMDAGAPVLTLENTPIGKATSLPYGHAKAYAEKEAHSAMPGRVTVVRPGLIVGPGDHTDRFTYWPVRINRGGEILVPGDGTDHVQIIDVRDLVEFNVRLIEDRTIGVFNAIGPHLGLPFNEFVGQIHEAVGGTGTYTWVDADFLLQEDVRPYKDLPVWQIMRGRTAGFAQFDLRPELKAGLKFRPLPMTSRETLDWFLAQQTSGETLQLKAGMTQQREAELLALWNATKNWEGRTAES